ncbi:hypothetical protein ADK55_18580 [Streptomyces sp. WM4235]|uniref:hypothetical protein n=1 Tax=Streptomyces sp. WM4235 TaxID=1415551 RepID=UPI0006AFA64D|nr:hypothetical protein [Streptomyces sp. WM4235]KOU50550.1 hypothetical protein ADK55_18580 [Streptomyces sp. WM4235]
MTDETERWRYAARIECAIGLNGGAGGSEGVKAARDAVLAVRDEELDAVRRRAIGHVEIIGDVRDWARKHLTVEQQEQLRDVLSRGRRGGQ